MKKIPEVIFVVDSIYEKQAVKEANNLKIKVFAIANTNGDDTVVSNLIPANTNSVKSIEFLSDSIGKSLAGVVVKRATTRKTLVKKPAPRTIKKTVVTKKADLNKTAPKVEKTEAKSEEK